VFTQGYVGGLPARIDTDDDDDNNNNNKKISFDRNSPEGL